MFLGKEKFIIFTPVVKLSVIIIGRDRCDVFIFAKWRCVRKKSRLANN